MFIVRFGRGETAPKRPVPDFNIGRAAWPAFASPPGRKNAFFEPSRGRITVPVERQQAFTPHIRVPLTNSSLCPWCTPPPPPLLRSFILIEISDTLKDGGKGAVWHMKRAVSVATGIITVFYFFVSILGYMAYGQYALYGESQVARCGRLCAWTAPNGAHGVRDECPTHTDIRQH